jgi:hypothetical protein
MCGNLTCLFLPINHPSQRLHSRRNLHPMPLASSSNSFYFWRKQT